MNNTALINSNSGYTEYGTPPWILIRASMVMGGIELDPASNDHFNAIVRARRIYTIDDDGLKQDWSAKSIWLNWPFGKSEKACKFPHRCQKKTCKTRGHHLTEDIPGNEAWVKKLIDAEAIHKMTICFNSTSEPWFQWLTEHMSIRCEIAGRVSFLPMDGRETSSPGKGVVLFYRGPNLNTFHHKFYKFGPCLIKL